MQEKLKKFDYMFQNNEAKKFSTNCTRTINHPTSPTPPQPPTKYAAHKCRHFKIMLSYIYNLTNEK